MYKIDPTTKPDHKYTWVFKPDGKPLAGTSGRILVEDAELIVRLLNEHYANKDK